MYEDHFGLAPRPFGERPGDASADPLPSRLAAVRRVRYALEQGQGPALIDGPPGVGKTWVARKVAEGWPGPVAHVAYCDLAPAEILGAIADGLGLPDPVEGSSLGVGPAARRLSSGLAALARSGARPLAVVDDAHLVADPATFRALRLVLNFATLGPPDLSLLLVAGLELWDDLPAPIGDRLAVRCTVPGLTASESSTYLEARLASAGSRRPAFRPEAVAELHRQAEGVPLALDRLADLSLLVAFAEGLDRVDAACVALASRGGPGDMIAA